MTMTTSLAQVDLTRQDRLHLWVRKSPWSQNDLARQIGVRPITISRWLRADRLPSWRVQQLRDLGIPEDLLPLAEDVSPGPKPRESVRSDACS